MSTVTPITNSNHFPSSLSTPVVEKTQYNRQDTVEKEAQKDIYAPKEPKLKTARKFSTEDEGDSLVHRIRSDKEQQKEAKEKEVPKDVSTALDSKEGVQAFAKVMEDYAKQVHNVGLRFSVHEDTGRTVVRIVDEKTDEVVREVPPEELLDLAAKMEQMMGMLLDEKA